jgi:hypothetical protein
MEQIPSSDLLQMVDLALSTNNKWMAFNHSLSFTDIKDVFFFKEKSDAVEFAVNNQSDVDRFQVIRISSLKEALSSRTESSKSNIQSTIKTNVMNTKNIDYLKDNLKYLGFGEKLNTELESNIQQGPPAFTLKIQNEFGKDKVEAQLHFRKSDQSDMYFFNRYEAKIVSEKDNHAQTFYLNKGTGVTFKEAYNLLSGRAVNKDLANKEGDVYNAWIQLNFKETEGNGNFKVKQYHQNYGYDLEKVLANHPIKELNNEQDRTRLLDSLNRGNRQAVTIIKDGTEQKHFVEANPQFKSVNVYDGSMQRLINKQTAGEKQTQGNDHSVKNDTTKERNKSIVSDTEDGLGVPELPKKRSRKQAQS